MSRNSDRPVGSYRFNPPPSWPPAPEGWRPPAGWTPDPAWPPLPSGWELWLPEVVEQPAPIGLMHVKGHTGQVEFDGQWLTIHRKGAIARLSVGKGDKRMPISSITAVQLKPAGVVVNGFIQFTLSGGSERRSTLGRQTTDAASDENSVVFTKSQMPAFVALREAVELAITNYHQPKHAPASVMVAPDPALQLRQLAELREAGIVTDEEFATKKAELLRRL